MDDGLDKLFNKTNGDGTIRIDFLMTTIDTRTAAKTISAQYDDAGNDVATAASSSSSMGGAMLSIIYTQNS